MVVFGPHPALKGRMCSSLLTLRTRFRFGLALLGFLDPLDAMFNTSLNLDGSARSTTDRCCDGSGLQGDGAIPAPDLRQPFVRRSLTQNARLTPSCSE